LHHPEVPADAIRRIERGDFDISCPGEETIARAALDRLGADRIETVPDERAAFADDAPGGFPARPQTVRAPAAAV
jgi:hypothetical protein